MKLTNKINKAFCLCLDKREAYWKCLQSQCETIGLDFIPFIVGEGKLFNRSIYSYIDDPVPNLRHWCYGHPQFKHHHYNAFMSHKIMLQTAKDMNLKYVLFLEDDAYITSRYLQVIDIIEKDSTDIDFNMMYLGWWIGREDDVWNNTIENDWNNKRIVSINRAVGKHLSGLHGVIIHKSMFDIMLSFPPIDPIDSQLISQLHHKIKSYYIAPKIIHTKSIYSYCEGNIIKRNTL